MPGRTRSQHLDHLDQRRSNGVIYARRHCEFPSTCHRSYKHAHFSENGNIKNKIDENTVKTCFMGLLTLVLNELLI